MEGIEPEFNPAMADDEPLTPFDVHERSERAGLIKLLIAAGVLLALALIVLKLYQPGVRARTDPPLITAENTPFKVVPEDPGGFQTPDQDREVFEVMSGNAPATEVVTLPAPEVPISVQKAQEPEREPVVTTPAPVVTTPEPTPAPVVSTPAPEPVARTPAPVQSPARAPAPATGSSDWVVQIASLRSQAEAQASYDAVAAKVPNILSSYSADIRRVDLAEKGIYFRARASGFADRDAANRTCTALKAAGQACFVTRR